MGREICSICFGSGEVWQLANPYSKDSSLDCLIPCQCLTGFAPRSRMTTQLDSEKALNTAVTVILNELKKRRYHV